MENKTSPAERLLALMRRAEMPAVFFAEDLAVHFSLDPQKARIALRRGHFGPTFRIDGQDAVLRDDLKEHLRLRCAQSSPADREVLGGEGPVDEEVRP